MPVLYITHGGGPLPLLGEPSQADLTRFLQSVSNRFDKPKAILIVIAHWEMRYPTLTSGAHPPLIYDYGGFPPESYTIQYPAPGSPQLANETARLLEQAGMNAQFDATRGFDHGMFVPLKLMYPDADIPCAQLSLLESLDPEEHIRMGEALQPLLEVGVLIVGSGSSFHNMRAMLTRGSGLEQAVEFNNWLIETCASPDLDKSARRQRLVDWELAPSARYCHPREEHLLPLHVCFGSAGGRQGEIVFNGRIMNLAMSSFYWA